MAIQESGEMYLETILILSREKEQIRSVDVSEKMNYSKPSVSRAVGILKNDGLIDVDKHGFITLTEEGRSHAEKIYQRHTVLTKVLMSLGVDGESAVADACRIEHVISDASMNAIMKHMTSEE